MRQAKVVMPSASVELAQYSITPRDVGVAAAGPLTSSSQLLVPRAAGEVLLTSTSVRGRLRVGMVAFRTSNRVSKASGRQTEPRRVPARQEILCNTA